MERAMKKDETKEAILRETIQLIREKDGDLSQVTARLIAERAGVSLGLINYHFGNKDNLILECTQLIINDVISSFKPDFGEEKADAKKRLQITAFEVFETLFANPALSRVSILGDLNHPEADSNTVKTMRGFMYVCGDDLPDEKKRRIAFLLVCAMQEAFLYADCAKEYLGYDFSKKSERKRFIDKQVELLIG